MHRLLSALAATVLLTAATPASAHAAACHRTSASPRVTAQRAVAPDGTARIVACDRARGRSVTLRRGQVGNAAKDFPILSAPAVLGTKVIWSELSGTERHVRQDLRTADVRHPGRVARRRIGPARQSAGLLIDAANDQQVLALPGGAWSYNSLGDGASTLVLERPGRAPRTLTRDASDPAWVEDGRTLVWQDGSGYHSVDVVPVPRDASGCPIRSRYGRVVADTPTLRVTAGAYGDQDDVEAYRACWKATGADATVLTTRQEAVTGIVQDGPYVALTVQDWDKYQQCQSFPDSGIFHVVAADARTGATTALQRECVALQSVALSTTGTPAWTITDSVGTQRVETAPGTANPKANTILDSAPAGSLAELTAAPTGGFTWTHDGALRVATA
jgi:hypothetical protein